MRRLLPILLAVALLLPSATRADSYTSLWKQVAAAQSKDLPQSEIALLQTIIDKATREQAYGHLLAAEVQTVCALAEISPDSVAPAVARLEEKALAAEEKNDIVAAIYAATLGVVYRDNADLSDNSAAISARYFDKAITNAALLSDALATDYVPFVVDGIDSRIFGDDILHIIGMLSGRYEAMHAFYDSIGNRPAACLCALEMIKRRTADKSKRMTKSTYLQSVDSLLALYGDLVEAGEVAIERYRFMEQADDATDEDRINFINYALTRWGAWSQMNILRNAQRRLTLPHFLAVLGDNIVLPGRKSDMLVTSVCNIGELKLTVRRVDTSGDTRLDPSDAADYARLRKLVSTNVAYSNTLRYIGQPEYKINSDTIHIGGLPRGVYLVELSADNTDVPVERVLLRVSGLYVVTEHQPNRNVRFVVLDAATGMPVSGAKIRVTMAAHGNEEPATETLTCGYDGEAVLHYTSAKPLSYYAFTDDDTALPELPLSGSYTFNAPRNTKDRTIVKLFTDRRIYRPAQTVNVAAVVYTHDRLSGEAKAAAGRDITLTLLDANGSVVDTKAVVTDDYGTASARFSLPSGALTGRYRITCDAASGAAAVFSVEQYRRPTFRVDISRPSDSYTAGDSMRLHAEAKTYAETPVQGARAVVTVVRRPAIWWRPRGNTDATTLIMQDTLFTDAVGTLLIDVPTALPESNEERPNRYYTLDVSVDITDAAGETHSATIAVPVSDRATVFTCDVPDRADKDSIVSVTFRRTNNAGTAIDGEVTYTLGSRSYVCAANEPTTLDIANLISGQYGIEAVCEGDTLRRDIIVFSAADSRVPVDTAQWFYCSAATFPADGGSVAVQCGSSDSIIHVVYSLYTAGKQLESGFTDLRGQLLRRTFEYREEYGDGILFTCAWVKDGRLHNAAMTIKAPQRDRKLRMEWQTFRDRLEPGQKETWTLTVTSPDGSPAAARMIATMYDKSLDDIVKHAWSLAVPTYTALPRTAWHGRSSKHLTMYGELTQKPFAVRALDYSRFDVERLSNLRTEASLSGTFLTGRPDRMVRAMQAKAADATSIEVEAAGEATLFAAQNGKERAEIAAPSSDEHSPTSTQMRENLDETAFFSPTLTTDSKGQIALKFTLPEAVTTWRLIGIAHDKEMNSGTIEAEAVARKTVMIVPNVPRFVREGDEMLLKARITNLSSEPVSGTARLEIVDATTEKTLYRGNERYTIAGGGSDVVTFAVDCSELQCGGLAVCRVTASGKGYSDGEQHYMAVVADKELVTTAVALSTDSAATLTVDLSQLFTAPSSDDMVTVEYTERPALLMLATLSSLVDNGSESAASLAAAYYALRMGRSIVEAWPDAAAAVAQMAQEQTDGKGTSSPLRGNDALRLLLLDETPWMASADDESAVAEHIGDFLDTKAIESRENDILLKLSTLQQNDGSFAWWRGMRGSVRMTYSVAEVLAKAKSAGETSDVAERILSSAIDFLAVKAAEKVEAMRQNDKKGATATTLSPELLHYLYVCALSDCTLSWARRSVNDYLIGELRRTVAGMNIYEKSLATIVLERAGEHDEAADVAQSIAEHTVYDATTGRYFDTSEAPYSWRDYRIPTQSAAIEALIAAGTKDETTVGEMQRWLLQSKRTQAWDNALNSVDAMHAFLLGNATVITTSGAAATIRINGDKVETTEVAAALGYIKASRQDDNLRSVTIEKTSDGTSWGAVYAQSFVPTKAVESSGNGIAVERRLLHNGVPMEHDGAPLNVGDRVTVVITLRAERDFDFVQVCDRRAACLEITNQMSGMRGGCYVAPTDNSTNYFFDTLPKGTHTISTDYYVSLAGTFTTGLCAAQCAYSTAYGGRDGAVTIHVSE